MGIKQAKIKCPHCGDEYVPRSENPTRCPRCRKTLPQQIFKPMTKNQLRKSFLWFVFAGFTVLFIGVMLEAATRTMAGVYLGLIGLLFFLVLGMPTYLEYRIYDLLHKPKSD